jgi:hypothetical protein
MKRLGLIVLVFIGLALSSCNWKTEVTPGMGIPPEVSHIEFWNGGGLMAEYDNARININIETATKLVGANVYFYIYEIRFGERYGQTEYIMDSEALSIKWY